MPRLLSPRLMSWLVCLPLLFGAASAATTSTNADSTAVSDSAGKRHDAQYREIFGRHEAWRWVILVRSSEDGGAPLGFMSGMSGHLTTDAFQEKGHASTLVWMDTQMNPQWATTTLRKEDGSISHRFRKGESEWGDDDDARQARRFIGQTLGFEASYNEFRDWIAGFATGPRPRTTFKRTSAGIHASHARIPQGKINWGAWQRVKTEKGQELPIPGTWTITDRRGWIMFEMVNFEAYEPDELPNPDWPYVVSTDPFDGAKESLVIPDEALDYQTW